MNRALTSAVYFIQKDGINLSYISKGASIYNVETLSSTSTDTTKTIRMYPRHITADRQSFPDLINKELIVFYVAGNCNLTPKQNDSIVYNGKTFTVDSFKSHFYQGQVCLYKVLAYA
jgi:hypothetical protein